MSSPIWTGEGRRIRSRPSHPWERPAMPIRVAACGGSARGVQVHTESVLLAEPIVAFTEEAVVSLSIALET